MDDSEIYILDLIGIMSPFLPSISAVTVSIFGFAVGFGRFLKKNCDSQSVSVLSFYGSRF